jgi:hypothetical protein
MCTEKTPAQLIIRIITDIPNRVADNLQHRLKITLNVAGKVKGKVVPVLN